MRHDERLSQPRVPVRAVAALSLLAAVAGGGALAARQGTPPSADVTLSMRGYSPAGAAAQRQTEDAFSGAARSRVDPHVAPLLHADAAPRHLAAHQGDRRVHRRAVEGAGPRGRRDPPLRRAVVESRARCRSRWWRRCATAVAARGSDSRRPRLVAEGASAARGLSFSASGDVTAPVVYANSGNPADYDLLRKHGIDPKGKIVIVRYSNPYSYRGFKALTAEREGAAAMIVYSDPAEDGYGKGEVFPKGPWGPASHLQRGGIAYDYIVPGDPLTPGWASTPGARRIPAAEAVSVPKIMALPMSHRDIQPILEKLGGPPAPDASGRARCRSSTASAAQDARLHVRIDMQTDVQPNYVVEGPHPRQRAARRVGGARQPPRRVGVRRRRSVERHGVDDGADQGARARSSSRACGRGARSSSAPGTAKRSRSPDRPSGASSSATSCGRRPSRI